MSPTNRWQSRSLFVSSTFDDMHAERDHLQQYVFPALEEWLRARAIHLETTDLRWGVETLSLSDRETKELTVLKVCLAEIDRSRPFLVVLLGDRYGWVPPLDRIASVATEMGMTIDGAPRSVTALEVEYGALKTSTPMRPLFYFREPLPYDRMPADVSARYSDEVASRESHFRLHELKQTIERQFPDRVRRYTAEWDASEQRLTGLQAFGDLVLRDLKSDIEAETRTGATVTASDWKAQEDELIDAFVEERCLGARGRAEIVDGIISRATATANTPAYAAIVGASGTGKSVVFALLARRLIDTDGVFLLEHCGGLTPRSRTVDGMLRRWIARMSASLGILDESDAIAAADALRARFWTLAERVASERRVVLLIDALDQFERTPEAAHLTWLAPRESWPDNVVVVATTTAGTESIALANRQARQIDLPPLERDDAAVIASDICARYHKVLPDAVRNAVLAKRGPDGQIASGNPLWLTLAVNELLLLDSDDFALMRDFTGTAEERLRELLLYTVESVPADLRGAYAYVYDRVERTYAAPFVANVLTLLSLSRSGLRESDLHAMLRGPIGWSASAFAAVRRALRAHVGARGRGGEWTFTHEQGRAAATARYLSEPDAAQRRHRELAAHLSALPKPDPLRDETMHHLLAADDREGARRYWTDASGEELHAAYDILKQSILAPDGDARIPFIVSLMGDPDQAPVDDTACTLAYLAGQRVLEFTEVSKLLQAAPTTLRQLLTDMHALLTRHLEQRRSAMTEDVLYRVLQNLGMVYVDLGDHERASDALERAAEINDRHAAGRRRQLERTDIPDDERKVMTIFYHQTERDRMLTFQRLGRVHLANRNREKARDAFERAATIAEFFLSTYPRSELAATDLAGNYYLIGDILLETNRLAEARHRFEVGLGHAMRDFGSPPKPLLVHLRINGNIGLARTHARSREIEPAVGHYTSATTLARDWARQDPGDIERQWTFLDANIELADYLAYVEAFEPALARYAECVEAGAALATAGHVTVRLLRYLRNCYRQQAIILNGLGRTQSARAAAERAAYLDAQLPK